MDKQTDGDRFRKLMEGMADNFRDTISKEGMRMRWEMLKGYSIDQVEDAGKKILATRKYTKMPPIAEFLDAINGGQVPIELKAEQQWTNVMLSLCGYSQLPMMTDKGLVPPKNPVNDIKDPITRHLATRRFTPQMMGMVPTKELPFLRREFIAAYCAEDARPQERISYDNQGNEVKQVAGKLFKVIE
jgi:hypothetical protein